MNISILKESLCIGGTEHSAANISVALAKKHNVTTILFDGREIVYPYGGNLVDMKSPPQTNLLKKIVNNIKRQYQLVKIIKKNKSEIVFFFIGCSSPINSVRFKDSVKLTSIRDFSVLTEKTELFKKATDSSDAVICNSEYIRDYYVSKYPEDSSKIFTVYNIIDVERIVDASKEYFDDEAFLRFRSVHKMLIVAVGRFCKEKAFENLLMAFKDCKSRIADVGLVFIGDGEFKEKCMNIVKEQEMGADVYFAGYQNNPYKYMVRCDAFVLSSRSEGFPNVLAEAMALSLPVISTNCFTGPSEMLMEEYDYDRVRKNFEECDYGILTPDYEVCGTEAAILQLSNAMVHLLSNKELMKKYSAISAQRVVEFSENSALERFEEIFGTLIKRRENIDKE